MGQATRPTRQNRTITVDFHDASTYAQLLGDGKAFIEFVLAFILAIGFQLRLLLDSRVVDVTMSYNPIFVMIFSLKALFFNGLKNEQRFLDTMEG